MVLLLSRFFCFSVVVSTVVLVVVVASSSVIADDVTTVAVVVLVVFVNAKISFLAFVVGGKSLNSFCSSTGDIVHVYPREPRVILTYPVGLYSPGHLPH